MFRVLIYRGSSNLGDAIQTYALCRLLGGHVTGVYRDGSYRGTGNGPPFIVNGWLSWREPPAWKGCIFAGVHLGRNEPANTRWIRDGAAPAGARDSYTAGLLRGASISVENIGCPTLAFDRYRGRRKGRFTIDSDAVAGTELLTQSISAISWKKQWELASARLELLRQAELVYTNRLHVILPCLAFGTPVCFPLNSLSHVFEKQRLTLLADLGFPFDSVVTMDVTAAADRYRRFLENATGHAPRTCRRPLMPQPD